MGGYRGKWEFDVKQYGSILFIMMQVYLTPASIQRVPSADERFVNLVDDLSIEKNAKISSQELVDDLAVHPEDIKRCMQNFRLCSDVSYYPTELVDKMVRERRLAKDPLFDQKPPEKEKHLSQDQAIAQGYSKICQSYRNLHVPKLGVTKDGKWIYIVQSSTLNFTQAIETEVCNFYTSNYTGCAAVENYMPSRYHLQCVQKYSIKNLIVVGTDPRAPVEIPTCCVCMYTIED